MTFIKPEITGILSEIGSEYSKNLIKYPLDNTPEIPVDVYITEQQYEFWSDVGVYLPYGSKLIKSYVRPEDHSLAGLSKLKEINPAFNFDSISTKSASASSNTQQGNGFFSSISKPPANTVTTMNSITKTHPGLNGKFEGYYLFQFDYNLVQSSLASLGVVWALPYDDDYQKGLKLDISLEEVSVGKKETLAAIQDMVNKNSQLNVKECVLVDNVITITFNSSDIYKFPYEYGVLNIGPVNNVSDCFSQSTLQRIYKHLKDNGYGDLEEVSSSKSIKNLPVHARKKGTLLATALRDSLIDVLGGSEGLLSVMQASTNEYLMGIINGLLAANKVVYDELDRIGGGRVKEKALQAFESGLNKSTASKGVKSLLTNGLELNQSTGKAQLATEPAQTVSTNIVDIKKDMQLSRNQANS